MINGSCYCGTVRYEVSGPFIDSLDTDPPLRSQRHIFTNYKAPWFEITDAAPQFPEGPPPQ